MALTNLTERLAKIALQELSSRYSDYWNPLSFPGKIQRIHISGRLTEQSKFIKQKLKEYSIGTSFKKGVIPISENTVTLIGSNNQLTTLPSPPFLTEIILLKLLAREQIQTPTMPTATLRELLLSPQKANIQLAIHFLEHNPIDQRTKIELIALYKLLDSQLLKRALKKLITRYETPNIQVVLSMKKKLKGNTSNHIRCKNLTSYSQLLDDKMDISLSFHPRLVKIEQSLMFFCINYVYYRHIFK